MPVFLGAIDIYYYDHRVYVVYMTFLSWGGCGIAEAEGQSATKQSLGDQATRSLQAVHRQRVLQNDIRPANMLVNAEIGGVMVIDFERAVLLEPPRQPLAQLIPNKRAREERRTDGKPVNNVGKGKQRFLQEVWEVKAMFAQ